MQSGAIQLLKSQFDALSRRTPEEGIEFWFARDLMEPLGYARWENFQTAIHRAMDSCETTGYAIGDHFRGVTKMVKLGSDAERPNDDFVLTRYACWLVAQNGDPRKPKKQALQGHGIPGDNHLFTPSLRSRKQCLPTNKAGSGKPLFPKGVLNIRLTVHALPKPTNAFTNESHNSWN